MGAGQSGATRTVHVDNHNPIGVVELSDGVVKRLKGQISTGNLAFSTIINYYAIFFYYLINTTQTKHNNPLVSLVICNFI